MIPTIGVTKIYGLVDPRDHTIRYVGKCITPLNRRLQNHAYKARSGRTKGPLGDWIRELQATRLSPDILLLEESTGRWQDAERAWITKLRSQGTQLLNRHPGGNGAHTRSPLNPKFVVLLGTVPDGDVAILAGLCRETITYHRRVLGIKACPRTKERCKNLFILGTPPHNKQSLPAGLLAQLGQKSDLELAIEYDVSRGLIKQRRVAAGVPACRPRDRGPKGSKHHKAKLNEMTVQYILGRYERRSQTNGCGALARELGLHISTVHRVVQKKVWKHVVSH